jgi:Tol biopolymer transport system component
MNRVIAALVIAGCGTSSRSAPSDGVLVMTDVSLPGTPIEDASIFTVRADGSDMTTLTGTGNQYPSWTPDGKIIFVSNRSGTRQIWTMEADGTAPAQIGDISLLESTEITRVQMADSGLVAFKSTGDGIWLIESDGSGLRELVKFENGAGDAPSLSRSGTWLTFTAPADATPDHNEIFRINTDGTAREQLTFFGDDPDGNASAISPDEATIAIFTGRESHPDDTIFTPGFHNIAVIGTHGGARTVVTTCESITSPQQIDSLTAADCLTSDNPSWSPDGRWIIYDRGTTIPEGAGTFVIDPDGNERQRLNSSFAGGGTVPFRFE